MKIDIDNTIVLNQTTSLCKFCKNGVEANIVQKNNKIFMRKECPEHGASEILVSSNAQWYLETLNYPAKLIRPIVKKEVDAGCPFDCGACTSHEQKVYLPVIPITSACNLSCPICYTINKNEGAYHISLEEFQKLLDVIKKNDPDMQLINLTGGEPTCHPQFMQIIRLCHQAGIHRITISTHGLSLIRDDKTLEELARIKARIVLSFDSFNDVTNKKMLGINATKSKLKVIEKLNEYNIDTTLIPVIAKGLNDHELKDMVDLMFCTDNLRSLEIHTMTFTGQGGEEFDPNFRITTPDVLEMIETFSKGKIMVKDFTPSPCAHPLCYQTCYLLKLHNGEFLPFTRFMSKKQMRFLLEDNLYLEPGPKLEEVLKDVINELWTQDIEGADADDVLKTLKKLLLEMYPATPISYEERQVISERSAKAIYIHAHMDEDNFDMDRIKQCSVGIPFADATNIPTCSYNVLYRERDPNFSTRTFEPIANKKGGKFW